MRPGGVATRVVTALNVYPYLPPVVRGDGFRAVVTDELDVPYVVRARLRSAGPGPRDQPLRSHALRLA